MLATRPEPWSLAMVLLSGMVGAPSITAVVEFWLVQQQYSPLAKYADSVNQPQGNTISCLRCNNAGVTANGRRIDPYGVVLFIEHIASP